MKKLSVLLVAAAVAFAASAGVNFKATHAMKGNKIINKEMVKFNPKQAKAKATSMRVITDQPEGELKSYSRAGDAVYVDGGYLTAGSQDGFRSDIVYGENGKVYIKNILCGCGSYYGDSWVEGTIEGNEIHVPLGQSIYWSDSYQADVVLAMGTTSVEGTSLSFDVDTRATEAIYVIDGETITLQDTYAAPTGSDYPEYEGYGLGCYWADDDSFGGFNEWNTVLTEREPVVTPEVITEIPEGCQVYTYYRNSGYIASSWFGIYNGTTDGKFTVAFDMTNGDVYIQNPMWWYDYNDVWVKGTYDWMTGIITIPTGQYLSWYDAYEYGVQLGWGSTSVYTDGTYDEETGEPNYYLDNELDTRTTEIQFMIDDDYIYLLGTEGDVNADFPENYNATGMYTYWSDDLSWTALEFANRDEYGYAAPFGYIVNLVPATPANPTADDWYDCGDESGFSKFYFTLPTTDVNGNMLDPEYLSYSVYVDNGNGAELFTFPASDYTFDLGEDITEVDYALYSDAVDFHDYYVYMYRTNAEGYEPLFTKNIGIQAFYTVNGEKNASKIAWLYEQPEPPTPQDGYQLVMLDMNGNPVVYDLILGDNGDYTTTVALNYDVFGGFDPMTEERPVVPFYFLVNGEVYGAEVDMTDAVLGDAMQNPLVGGGCFTVPVGYNYNIGIAFSFDGEDMYAYVAQAGYTNVNELNSNKTVANVRYFNVTGQEMAQPEGVTIKVTTYTDGTTSTAKVVK